MAVDQEQHFTASRNPRRTDHADQGRKPAPEKTLLGFQLIGGDLDEKRHIGFHQAHKIKRALPTDFATSSLSRNDRRDTVDKTPELLLGNDTPSRKASSTAKPHTSNAAVFDHKPLRRRPHQHRVAGNYRTELRSRSSVFQLHCSTSTRIAAMTMDGHYHSDAARIPSRNEPPRFPPSPWRNLPEWTIARNQVEWVKATIATV